MRTNEIGPELYELFKLNIDDKERAFEFPLFSDARVEGELAVGPILLINPVAIDCRPGFFRPAIIVRSKWFTSRGAPDLSQADDTLYHGGWFGDEVAAVISLLYGVRVQAGAKTRTFEPGTPMGRPIAWQQERWPESVTISARPILHRCLELKLSKESIAPLSNIANLTVPESRALIKAARLYQQAMWIAESEASLSWVFFVSAIEAVSKLGPLATICDADVLKFIDSDLLKAVTEKADPELTRRVAKPLRSLASSAQKFSDFLLTFLPEPPKDRPKSAPLIDWSPKALKKSFQIIYRHRSKALHAGTPFPAPMCRAPFRFQDDMPVEMPIGLSSGSNGGVWPADQTPLMLHVFEYIVRGALLNWWKERMSRSALLSN